MKNNLIYIALFALMFFVHLILFQRYVHCCEVVFVRYYLFLTILFMMVITLMSVFKRIYPNYLGFVFLGLVLVKLTLMFLVMNKLKISDVPYYKLNFIVPYLISLFLVTLYSVNLIKKDEKNQ